ncbi:hypothetical protein GCM10022377_22020 [Zhihengliuella alba]|uniref:Uncharacterized protein n=1 Tax=Zhihengliuella alba TaxID=547018 RepID=A0ABP7DMP5_9MICC
MEPVWASMLRERSKSSRTGMLVRVLHSNLTVMTRVSQVNSRSGGGALFRSGRGPDILSP